MLGLSKGVEISSEIETPGEGFCVTRNINRPLPASTLYVCVVLAGSCERSCSLLHIRVVKVSDQLQALFKNYKDILNKLNIFKNFFSILMCLKQV